MFQGQFVGSLCSYIKVGASSSNKADIYFDFVGVVLFDNDIMKNVQHPLVLENQQFENPVLFKSK